MVDKALQNKMQESFIEDIELNELEGFLSMQ